VIAPQRENSFFLNENNLSLSEIELSWDQIIKDFINEEIKNKKYIISIQRDLRDFLIFIDKKISSINKEDVFKYERYLYLKVKSKDISISVFNFRIKSLISFIVYLYRINQIDYLIALDLRTGHNINLKIAAPNHSIRKLVETNSSKIIDEFLSYLSNRNYAIQSTNYRIYIIHFSNFLWDLFKLDIQDVLKKKDGESLLNYIKQYENMFSRRIALEEIQITSAYHYLKALRLFINFLREEKHMNLHYVIDEKFSSKGNRGNDFIPTEDILKMLEVLYKYSKNFYRDLSIFLLFIDIGCRSIEIRNIKLKDINLIERTIQITSKKSGTRTLQVSKEVMDVVKDYLSIRYLYVPDNEFLFLKSNGQPITKSTIEAIFNLINRKEFFNNRPSSKAFRHTFITNALENGNTFDKVSKIVGHKHWISTFYYLHRSKKLLLKNTIEHSPLKVLGGE
jgi:integrase/recombinase XerC